MEPGATVRKPGRPRISVCQRGHEFSGDNVFVARDGRRKCRTCKRMRERANHRALPGARRRHSPTSLQETLERRAMALRLRAAGATYERISGVLGVSTSSVWQMVRRWSARQATS